MSADGPAVQLRGVWRRYRRSSRYRRASLRATLAAGHRGFRHEWMWALRDVDLDVHPGRALGIVGPNGAGKSTLLRLAGGVGRPDRGCVRVRGRVGALLNLGREFHPDLSGRQNAELAAVVAGMTRGEFRRRLPSMIEFSGLDGFVDEPLRAYSDGMKARLAFAVAAEAAHDVLLLDEVLAVGDAAFQRRSIERISKLRDQGVAILFVSHDLTLVREVCDEAAWLERGRIRSAGDATRVVNEYLRAATAPALRVPRDAGETGQVRIRVLDLWGIPTDSIRSGDGLLVEIEASARSERANVSVIIRRSGAAEPTVDTSTTMSAAEEQLRLVFERLDLNPGRYDVVVSLFTSDWDVCLNDQRWALQVRGEGPERAALAPPHEWRRR